MPKPPDLRARLAKAKLPGTPPEMVERARKILLVFYDKALSQGAAPDKLLRELANGAAATGIGWIELQSTPEPEGLDCAQGCAFCCILTGDDGGTITGAEARNLYEALSPLAGQPDGRAWHPKACPSLDPETRMCRAYAVRPMICRSYVSTDVDACEAVSMNRAADGPGVRGAQTTYLTALALCRVALKGVAKVSTYSMSQIAAAAIDGQPLTDALKSARQSHKSLDDERKRHVAALR